MIYHIYKQYGLAMDVVIQAAITIGEGVERLAIFHKIIIACLVISASSVILSNFGKYASLVVSLFPIVVIVGCSFLISGSITTFVFPWLFFIPIIYILSLIIYDLYNKEIHKSKIYVQIKFNKYINVYSLIAVIASIFLVQKANTTYQAITVFGDLETLFFKFFILMSVNYLILVFSILVFIINKKIGTLLSIFPICLHLVYDYFMNQSFPVFTNVPWEFFLPLLLVLIPIWLELKNYKMKKSG